MDLKGFRKNLSRRLVPRSLGEGGLQIGFQYAPSVRLDFPSNHGAPLPIQCEICGLGDGPGFPAIRVRVGFGLE